MEQITMYIIIIYIYNVIVLLYVFLESLTLLSRIFYESFQSINS